MGDDHPDDKDAPPLAPFPTAIPPSPFPPMGSDQTTTPSEPADPADDWTQAADAHDPSVFPDLSVAQEAQRQNRLLALGRFAFPPEPWLDDEAVAARDRRWTSRAIAVTTVFLLIFNAVSIQNWSRQQAPGWVTSTVQQLSDVWAAQLAQLGADQPRQGVRETYQAAQAQRFPGQMASSDPTETVAR